MVADGHWLTTAELAKLAAITPQAARRALQKSSRGLAWRGAALVVRHRFGRGGRGGLLYEVALESLPEAVKFAAQSSETFARACDFRAARSEELVVSKRWEVVADAVGHPGRSAQRAVAIANAALRSGRSERTLRRWIDRYERLGVRGLAHATAPTACGRRVIVSRIFDRACREGGHPEELLSEIGSALEKSLKGLWASRAESAGATEVRRLAEYLLLELCEARGLVLPDAAMRLSRRGVERFAGYRVVNQRRNDRKTFDDRKPRIRRDWTGLAPMERIVADVKHLDVIVTRPDGTSAWPKIIAFMDAGTGRVLVHPVLLERGEGVRQEHVIEGFLAMVSQPAWGFPQGLYLDNGSEFGAMTKISAALELINEPGARTLIFARPYNASAKPIESLFARLDRYVFSLLPGYAGPNRMAKRTQTVGKPPRPYPGTWDDFRSTLQELIAAHNLRPVGGQWDGRSPQEWLQDKAAAGWRSVTVDPFSLDAAFADHDSRRVDRGVVHIKGKRFTHAALAALPSRTVVDLALPWRRDAEPLARISGTWTYLQCEVRYPARWIEGARESDRRQKSQSRHVAALAREALSIDPVATKIRWARRMAPEPDIAERAKLDLGGQLEELGRSACRSVSAAASRPSIGELRRVREMALTERLERRQRR